MHVAEMAAAGQRDASLSSASKGYDRPAAALSAADRAAKYAPVCSQNVCVCVCVYLSI